MHAVSVTFQLVFYPQLARKNRDLAKLVDRYVPGGTDADDPG